MRKIFSKLNKIFSNNVPYFQKFMQNQVFRLKIWLNNFLRYAFSLCAFFVLGLLKPISEVVQN